MRDIQRLLPDLLQSMAAACAHTHASHLGSSYRPHAPLAALAQQHVQPPLQLLGRCRVGPQVARRQVGKEGVACGSEQCRLRRKEDDCTCGC